MRHETTIEITQELKDYWQFLQKNSLDALGEKIRKENPGLTHEEEIKKLHAMRSIFDTDLTAEFDDGATVSIGFVEVGRYHAIHVKTTVKSGSSLISFGSDYDGAFAEKDLEATASDEELKIGSSDVYVVKFKVTE